MLADIDPGELDQRVVIEQEATSADGMGGSDSTWATVATVWAKVRPMSGKERSQGDQVESPANYVVIIRNRALQAKYRLRWESNNNKLMNIRFFEDDPRAEFIKIDVELGVAT